MMSTTLIPDREPTLPTQAAYERIMELIGKVRDEISDLAGDVRVMAQKVNAMEEHLRTLNGKVANHQTWIDQRQGQISMSVGMVGVGVALGGIVVGIVMHFLR